MDYSLSDLIAAMSLTLEFIATFFLNKDAEREEIQDQTQSHPMPTYESKLTANISANPQQT